ncbi:hypothetical protein HMPREF0525_01310 [Lactobacillus jensenii 27-2-CHN]|jgi:hypothetical protein|uniref:hypothetical protein n=1 Tax=Lactobacillus mulieris TaxID=2508708 RepID=UPI00019C7C96|nr:hypothetical protein HMPREF0525_01310 [Lactobacillus jensenii 27-2-CHN]EEX23735.1 hypothetical protein HMPREF0974_00803 [Lactobacillus jensenii 115-3-CHN]EFH29871.1 hypothetical protein HMPREF0526_10024 [Lactobacillus jensenii JV-V16]
MVNFFFILADVITILFAILIIILLVCQWVIYFRVEKTILSKESSYEKEEQNA